MRKLMLVFALVIVASGTLMATSPNAAIVINRGTGACGMPGSDANGNIIFGGIGVVKVELEHGSGWPGLLHVLVHDGVLPGDRPVPLGYLARFAKVPELPLGVNGASAR
jgi:hypothetical protein